ncbi:MAG TPA: TlpA disulfide reductase family protein [Fimbriimonadaceae bacterium]|nr:TlpA disulfide reductase family protein [Fimbriimonadaceae bacterium]
MNYSRTTRFVTAIGLAASAAFAAAQLKAQAPSVTLHVGDPAPAISVMKWIKGQPIDLKDGKVHVVEFWATWCGPCKVGMPHLSELAKKFNGKVVFTGVSVWEENAMKDKTADTMPKVESFVEHAHDMMAYNVAADGSAKVMANTWMMAAGQHGIPAAFIVDQEGKIAWIGHPLMGLGEALPLVLDHKFDKAAAEKIAADWQDRLKKGQDVMKDLQEAQKAKDYAKVAILSDQVEEDMPFAVTFTVPSKYVALTHTDPAAAAKFADHVVGEYANAPLVLMQLAGAITGDDSVAGKPDYTLAMKLMKEAENCVDPDYGFETVYAQVCAKSGNASDAVKWQGMAVQALQAMGAPQQYVDSAQKKLDEYKAASAAKGGR